MGGTPKPATGSWKRRGAARIPYRYFVMGWAIALVAVAVFFATGENTVWALGTIVVGTVAVFAVQRRLQSRH